jgi:hypothetical protein
MHEDLELVVVFKTNMSLSKLESLCKRYNIFCMSGFPIWRRCFQTNVFLEFISGSIPDYLLGVSHLERGLCPVSRPKNRLWNRVLQTLHNRKSCPIKGGIHSHLDKAFEQEFLTIIDLQKIDSSTIPLMFLTSFLGFWERRCRSTIPPINFPCKWWVMRHGVDDVNHRPVGNPKRKVWWAQQQVFPSVRNQGLIIQ